MTDTEVIFGAGKSAEHVVKIVQAMAPKGHNILVTRATAEQCVRVKEAVPEAELNEAARTIVVRKDNTIRGKGTVMVISAGTSDIPVAEEALVTLSVMGNNVEKLYDVALVALVTSRHQTTCAQSQL